MVVEITIGQLNDDFYDSTRLSSSTHRTSIQFIFIGAQPNISIVDSQLIKHSPRVPQAASVQVHSKSVGIYQCEHSNIVFVLRVNDFWESSSGIASTTAI